MHFLQAIKSDISVLIVCNKTGGTIQGDIKKTVGYYTETIKFKNTNNSKKWEEKKTK